MSEKNIFNSLTQLKSVSICSMTCSKRGKFCCFRVVYLTSILFLIVGECVLEGICICA